MHPEVRQVGPGSCPKCGMALEEVVFRDVKVDTCFHCDGMFLDAGELEKILAHKDGGWFQSMATHCQSVPLVTMTVDQVRVPPTCLHGLAVYGLKKQS